MIDESTYTKGWEKLIPDDLKDMYAKDFNTVSQRAKEYIGLDDFWYKEHRDKGSAYKYLRDVLENKGIIVMQVVGKYKNQLLSRAIVTVSKKKIRIRQM